MPPSANKPQKPSKAEQTLLSLGIDYTKQPDGTLVVPGEIDLSGRGLTSLPDLSTVVVEGSFKCGENQLTSLKGAPKAVGRSFYCNENYLTSLVGAPRTVGGDFHCSKNELGTLKGAPDSVGRAVYCFENRLANLDQAPASFGSFLCERGSFASWEDIPDDLAPKGKAQYRERKLEQTVHDATVLEKDVPVGAPMRFKNKLNL